jgi:uncharacterized membrane protein
VSLWRDQRFTYSIDAALPINLVMAALLSDVTESLLLSPAYSNYSLIARAHRSLVHASSSSLFFHKWPASTLCVFLFASQAFVHSTGHTDESSAFLSVSSTFPAAPLYYIVINFIVPSSIVLISSAALCSSASRHAVNIIVNIITIIISCSALISSLSLYSAFPAIYSNS